MEDDDEEVDQTFFDSLILQVFEEQEERCGSLTYPLSTQRDALDFVKLINRKGFPYVSMCQAIDEKQERFRSWRLGNGNSHIGLVMMKRINKTVQEAMMLPDADADIDIDDLIDDDDEEEEEELSDNDDDFLTTDEDEHHLASSPPPSAAEEEPVDNNETSVADTSTDATESEISPPVTSSSNEDISKTSGLTESQVSEEQQQQQLSINSDDVMVITANTGELPELGESANEPRTEDAVINQHQELIPDQGECPKDEDRAISLMESQQEPSNVADDKVQLYSSDTPDIRSEVCPSTVTESTASDNSIPSPSSPLSPAAEPDVLLAASPEHSDQQREAVSAPQLELSQTSEEQERDEQNDLKCIPETADQAHTERYERETEEQISSQLLEQQVESTLDSTDGPTTDQSRPICVEEKHEQIVNGDITPTNAEEQPTSSTDGDGMTSQHDDEVGHDEVKVAEEQAKVTEEVKVVYEASAKQLDLLSRLAMLREKAAQRKAEQGPDNDVSTQDNHLDTSSTGDTAPSIQTGDSKEPPDQSSEHHEDVSLHVQTENDFSRRHTDINENKQTPPGTDNETGTARADVDTEQDRQGTASTSNAVADDKNNYSQLAAGTNNENTIESATTHGDVQTEAQKSQTADNSGSREPVHITTTDKSTIHTQRTSHHDVSNAENFDIQNISDSTNTPTDSEVPDATAVNFNVLSSPVHDDPDDTGLSAKVHTDKTPPAESRLFIGTSAKVLQQTPIASDLTQATDQDQLETAMAMSDKTSEQSYSEQTKHNSASNSPGAALPAEISNHGGLELSGTVHKVVDQLDNHIRDEAINYDSDLDSEFADSDVRQLLTDIRTLKASKVDGQGYLYVLADRSRQRFTVAASRSPAKRLRQAITFNPDLTLLASVPVSRRLAAVGKLRRRLAQRGDVTVSCLPGSRDWFSTSDDVINELVGQVAADCDRLSAE